MSDSTANSPNLPDPHRGNDPASSSGSNPPGNFGSASGSSAPLFSTGQDVSPDDMTVVGSPSPLPASTSPIASSATHELGRLLEGEQLGHFKLEEFIGGGGMGAVFRGTDVMLGRTVAIKVLSPNPGADDETTRRFRLEAQSTARLDHDNIARVYYVGEERGWHYIVLEYIEGENLRDLIIKHGVLSLAEVVSFTIQIAEALSHASSRDVVHRDIKPSNVLITTDRHAKVVDMGLARLHQVDQTDNDLTASGVTLGTFDYISPEQARDPRVADVRSDLYSLGCTFYYMLTGRPPFPDGTVLQKLLQHQGDEPIDPRRFRNDLPEEVSRITRKLLAKDPEHRFQTPDELIGALLVLSSELNLQVPQRTSEEWVPAPSRESLQLSRHLPWAVPVAILLAIVLTLKLFPGNENHVRPPSRNGSPEPNQTTPVDPSREGSVINDTSSTSSLPESNNLSPTKNAPNSMRSQASSPMPSDAAGLTLASPEDSSTYENNGTIQGATDRNSNEPNKPSQQHPMAPQVISSMQPLIVGDSNLDSPVDQMIYATLTQACRAARPGSVIELRYNGRRDKENPIQLIDQRLTIRAGKGFEPVVRFHPATRLLNRSPRSMFKVAGGDLTLINVHLEMTAPNTLGSDRWSLIEATKAEQIVLRGCTLTVRAEGFSPASFHQRISIFDISAQPSPVGVRFDSEKRHEDLKINLVNCIVRGDAAFMRGNALGTVQLNWTNGLAALSNRFLVVEADQKSDSVSEQLQVNLEHITLLARRGLCLMASGENAGHFPDVWINSTDCILMTQGSPLLEQQGPQTADEFQDLVRWTERGNFYEKIDVYWRIDPAQTGTREDLNWNAWRTHWGIGADTPAQGAVWQSLDRITKRASKHQIADYQLDESIPNPALGAATDGQSNVGFRPELLPTLPAETAEQD